MRSAGNWKRLWSIWVALFAGSGVALDTAAFVWGGYDSTLTASIRRWTQLEPRGKYSRLGLCGLVGFFIWCIVHLGWGALDPLPRKYSPLISDKALRAALDYSGDDS